MGYLVYDSEKLELNVDDRTLAHLQIVIINKLRKGESFVFSWQEPPETGDGRSTIWLDPHISLRFKFAGSRIPEINAAWLEVLYDIADSGRGLHLIAEPAARDAQLPETAVAPIGAVHDPRPVVKTRTPRLPTPERAKSGQS